MPFAGHLGAPKSRVRDERTSRAAAEVEVMRRVSVSVEVSSFMVSSSLISHKRVF